MAYSKKPPAKSDPASLFPDYQGLPSACSDCPRTKKGAADGCRFVPPDYPSDWSEGLARGKRILFVGERPVAKDAYKGRAFVSDGGVELMQTYLPAAGLYRDLVGLTYAIHCPKPGTKKTEDKEVDACAGVYLRRELRWKEPDIIVPMGASAASVFDGCIVDWHTDSVDLDLDHGMPLRAQKWGQEYVVWPIWHPAAGMADPDYMVDIKEDMAALRSYLRGEWAPVKDLHPDPRYIHITDVEHLYEVFMWCADDTIALDTESLPDGTPYCLTFALQPDCGYLIMREDRELITALGQLMRDYDLTATCHYYLHDEMDLRLMGLQLPWNPNRMADTMMEAYHLQLTSQSLKVLSWRLMGIRMREFNDVVRPHALAQVRLWLQVASETEWDKGQRKPRQTAIHKRAARIAKDLDEEAQGIRLAAKPCNPWEMWEGIDPEVRWPVERELGPMPAKSIAHVPFNELLQYACQDAISTLRLRPVLRAMAIQRQKGVAR